MRACGQEVIFTCSNCAFSLSSQFFCIPYLVSRGVNEDFIGRCSMKGPFSVEEGPTCVWKTKNDHEPNHGTFSTVSDMKVVGA